MQYWQQKENQAEQREEQQLAPTLRQDETGFRRDIMSRKIFRRGLDAARKKMPPAAAMQLEFLDPLGKRPEVGK
ncbi:MAG: hypothetical protein JF609_00090 [Verrucomicrobia bacterium]|nr:hypothetical protein [Verrucomicrobiota bacterium]